MKRILVLFAAAAMAQTAAPTIAPEHEAAFLAAEGKILEAQHIIQANQPLAQQAAAAMQKDCGDAATVQRDSITGRFSCVAKPPTPAAPAK